ncbi:MAG: uncharacterized protein JWL84_2658 [Rhodospirillales bacterium]|nr:uncharacterized protein [Rhodospirillales bacterium]
MTKPIDAIHWTPRLVEAYVAEAAVTLHCLPEQRVQGYVNTWPEIQSDACDTDGVADRPTRFTPSPNAIDQMDRVLLWLRWLKRDDQRIVWERAKRRPWKDIAHEHGADRSTVWRRWTYALVTIAARLNASADAALLQQRTVQHPGPRIPS